MSTIYRFRVRDTDAGVNREVLAETAPTSSSLGYTIDTDQTTILEELKFESKTTHDSLMGVRALPYDPDREPFRAGYRFFLTGAGQHIFDILIDPATMVGADGIAQLMGGKIRVPSDVSASDYMEGVLIDKTGVIPDMVDGSHPSLMEHYGLPVDGSAALEISHKFLKQCNVPVGDPAGQGFNPGGNFEVPGGIYVRFIYNANNITPPSDPIRLDLNFAK